MHDVLLSLFSHWVVSGSFATPWSIAHQAPLSMKFPRQEYWSGLPLPSAGELPQPRDRTCVFSISKQSLYHWASGSPRCPVGRFYLVTLFLVKDILMIEIGGGKKRSINSILPGFPPEYTYGHTRFTWTLLHPSFFHTPVCCTVSQASATTSYLTIQCPSHSDCPHLFTVMSSISRNGLYRQRCPFSDLSV